MNVVPWPFSRRAQTRLAVLALLLLHTVWFWDVLTGERFLFMRDLLRFLIPYRAEAGRALAQGQFPALSMALLAGMPLWAHPSAQVADPGTLLFALFKDAPLLAQGYDTALHSVTASVGVLALGRLLGLRPVWCLWAAVAYAGCGPVISGWCIREVTPTALPWVACGGALMARGNFGRAYAVSGLAVGYLFLNPDPPSVGSAVGVAWLLCWARARKSTRVARSLHLMAAGILGALLAGAFWVPALEVVAASPRGNLAQWSAQTSLGWRWLELVAPAVFGVPGAAGPLLGAFQSVAPQGFYVGSVYLGGTVLWGALALSWTSRTQRALILGAAVLLLLAHGDGVPGMGALWSAVHARLPEKLLTPAYLLAILGAARAVQPLSCGRTTWPRGWWVLLALGVAAALAPQEACLAAVQALAPGAKADAAELFSTQCHTGGALLVTVTLLAALTLRRAPSSFSSVILILACGEATWSASAALLTAPMDQAPQPTLLGVKTAAGVTFPLGAAVFCCDVQDPLAIAPTTQSNALPPFSAALENAHRGGPLSGAVWELHHPVAADMGGFEPMAFHRALPPGTHLPPRGALNVLSEWGVEWVVSLQALSWDQGQVSWAGHLVPTLQQPLWTYHLAKPAPRLALYARSQGVTSGPDAVALMARGDNVLPLQTQVAGALLESEPGTLHAPEVLTATRVKVGVDSAQGIHLAYEGLYQKGWEARVDGQAAALWIAKGIHMAVWVPPGEHVVELSYRIPGLRLGFLLSALGAAGLCAAWLVHRRRENCATPQPWCA